MKSRLFAITIAAMTCLAGGALGGCHASSSPTTTKSVALTDTREDRVTHTVQLANGDWESRTYRANGEKLLDATIRHPKSAPVMEYVLYVKGEARPQRSVPFTKVGKLDKATGKIQQVDFQKFHAFSMDTVASALKLRKAPPPGSSKPFYFDNFGCDGGLVSSCPDAQGNGGENGACCDAHDQCFAVMGCVGHAAPSWLETIMGVNSPCAMCNRGVADCIAFTDPGPSQCCSYPPEDPHACGKPNNDPFFTQPPPQQQPYNGGWWDPYSGDGQYYDPYGNPWDYWSDGVVIEYPDPWATENGDPDPPTRTGTVEVSPVETITFEQYCEGNPEGEGCDSEN